MGRPAHKDFVVQGSVLAAAGIISRIIGLLYKVPLVSIIGEAGTGVFNTAYNIYSILLLISSYSLPMAVSKMISAKVSGGHYREAKQIFRVSLLFGFGIALAAALLMYFGADLFAGTVMNMPGAALAVRLLAPAVLIMGVLGVLRGFFQGHGNMVPTAVSQIIEQVLHVVISLLAAYFLFTRGPEIFAGSRLPAEDLGAAGAASGTAAGALAAFLFLLWLYFRIRGPFEKRVRRDTTGLTETAGDALVLTLRTALPILISAAVYNLITILDQAMFARYVTEDYSAVWGVYTGKYTVLYNVPVAIASALSASVLPQISAAMARGEKKTARAHIERAVRFTLIIALPCTVAFAVLGRPCMDLLFSGNNELAGTMMTVGSTALLFFSLSTLTNAILQGTGHFWVPIRNCALALALHLPLLALSLWGFQGGILAVVIQNCQFPLFVCIFNAISLRRILGYRQELLRSWILPAAVSGLMGLGAWLLYTLLYRLFAPIASLKIRNLAALLPTVLVSIALYFAGLLLSGAVRSSDLEAMPKGASLVRLAQKLHLIR